MSDDQKELKGPRKRIDEIDEKILDLLSERNQVVQDVIQTKIEKQLPIFVAKREDAKTRSFREMAKKRNLDPDWAEDFLRMIMGASRASQSTNTFPRATDEVKHICIFGGKGSMGRLYARIGRQTGHEVYTIDKDNWDELDAFVDQLDLAIVSVPINVTGQVIEQVAEKINSDTILADFTSQKTDPLQKMLEVHDGPVLGLHPMHGPDVQNLSKQLLVVCEGRDMEKSKWVVEQAQLWGMRIKEADPENHDHAMNLVQGLRHYVALLHGSFMKEYDLNPDDILDFSSPIYRAELMMTGRIFAQDAELYADIVLSNEERRQLLLKFFEHHYKLAELVKRGDKEAFIREFESISDFFGDFAQQALEESGYLINRLADRFT
mgnify:CR=1 FL=1